MQIFDISQTIAEKMAVWPGDRKFRSRPTMRIKKGGSCNVAEISMSTHTGTHLDAPYHFDDSGADIASVPLHRYIGPARVVTPGCERCIAACDLQSFDWQGVERVLFRTRLRDLTPDRFDRDYVYLARDGAEYLSALGLLLIGTDAPSIDPFASKDLQAHKELLSREVAILEGLRLEGVPDGDYELICLPLRLAGLDGSPVRAILRK
jgi:arylformamidase